MASGSSGSGRSGNANAKGFDFGSDDILCSYDDYSAQPDSTNGTVPDPPKDFHKSRIARSSVFPTASFNQPENSFTQEVLVAVERSMKKHTENLLRFLEGISSRMSQLELYCYNLDKSISEMRSDLVRDHGEADTKLRSLEKHLQEVHRSVQILRDKQELADAQKELAKLHLAQKESASSSHSQSVEERATPPAADPKKNDNTSEAPNQQLALALPHQVMPRQQSAPVPPPSQAPTQTVTQQQSYYLPPTQLPSPSMQTHHPQAQYLPSDPQYRATQLQDLSRIPPQPVQTPPQPVQTQVNQTPAPGQQYPQYQQQWLSQLPQQVTPPQQTSMQPQIRPPSPAVYTTYQPPGQPPVQTPELLPDGMPVQVPYPSGPQPLTSRADVPPYGYGAGRTMVQQPPPQQIKPGFGPLPADGYAATGSPLPSASAYMIYDGEGGRHNPPQQPHYQQGVYPPTNVPLQNPPPAAPTNVLARNTSPSPYLRNHPHSQLIEKLVSMGFRVDHVVSVIQRMEESGQPVDFNVVLDRLGVHSSGVSQRGW